MSDYSGRLEFQYDPDHDPPRLVDQLKPGSTPGWVVMGAIEPGAKVQVAESIMLTDPDGNGFIEVGEFVERTVVDSGDVREWPK